MLAPWPWNPSLTVCPRPLFTHSGALPARAAQAIETTLKRIPLRAPSPIVPSALLLSPSTFPVPEGTSSLFLLCPQMTSPSSEKGALCSPGHCSGLHIICITGLPWFPTKSRFKIASAALSLPASRCAVSPSPQRRCDSSPEERKVPKSHVWK